jgi:hypothetical protein
VFETSWGENAPRLPHENCHGQPGAYRCALNLPDAYEMQEPRIQSQKERRDTVAYGKKCKDDEGFQSDRSSREAREEGVNKPLS